MVEIRPRIRRAFQVLRVEGVRTLWFKLLGETVYRRLLLIERQIGDAVPSTPNRELVSCRQMTPSDLAAFSNHRCDADVDLFRKRLEAGEICFVVLDGGKIVHSCWTATKRAHVDYLDLDIVIAPDAVYVYEVFTSDSHRGRSISSARSIEMERYFESLGYKRLVAAVGPENRPVTRSKDKAGYATIGKIGRWRFGPLKSSFCECNVKNPSIRLA